MKLEHFGSGRAGPPLTATPKSLNGLMTEQAAPDAPQAEEALLTAAVNRTILRADLRGELIAASSAALRCDRPGL